MSRSYKHYPVCTSRTSRYAKRCANRRFRKITDVCSESLPYRKSNLYRRYYQSWNICEYKMYGIRHKNSRWFIPVDSNLWEKWYRRK